MRYTNPLSVCYTFTFEVYYKFSHYIQIVYTDTSNYFGSMETVLCLPTPVLFFS